MSTTSIRGLLEQLVGHQVRVFTDDHTFVGVVTTLTDGLVALCGSDGHVIYVELEDVQAVSVEG